MKIYFFILLIFFPTQFRELPSPKNMFVVWNVGQGLWSTLQTGSHCRHFDFGGEKFSATRFQTCFNQEVYLTHLDQDHVSFLSKLKKKACLHPLAKIQEQYYLMHKVHKMKWMQILNDCPATQDEVVKRIFPRDQVHLDPKFKDNDLSSVYLIRKSILVPGDSTIQAEAIWQKQNLSTVKVLVLGHHGSSTSTGESLLKALPQLQMTVSSSRFAKYHHPSAQTVSLLKQKKIPNLRTEDWGSIGIELKMN